jgi:DNA repair protein SbcC/Rad50
MILAAVEIENYKQYAGSHCIDFPEQGMVAITGPNGAGKTTLFEAIEWCLYGPHTIPHASIPPHDGVGSTLVRVTLQDPHDGRRYVVKRTLRKGVSAAEAYAEDDPGQPLVQGPRDVSDFVAKQLVGLPHAAFVSTFFTRQKELTFFGDRKPTDRRVEVARLLGFQIVRDAQEEIGAERNQARHEAISLSALYAEGSEGRDFAAEIASAEATLREAQEREGGAARNLSKAEAAAERTRSALDAWRNLQEQDNVLGTRLADIAGQTATAASRRDAATAELSRLDQREAERAVLLPEAETAAPLAFEVTLLDEQRDRAERLRSLQVTVQASTERIDAIGHRLGRLVIERLVDGMALDGWSWGGEDIACPEAGIERLLKSAASLDARGARDRVDALRTAHLTARIAAEKRGICERYRKLLDDLSSNKQALMAPGDPGAAVVAARDAARRARETTAAAREQLAIFGKSRDDAVRMAKDLRKRAQEPICPTCARPLGAEEAERLAALLDKEIEQILDAEAALECDTKAASVQAEEAERAEAEARKRQNELISIDARIADGLQKIAEADEEHERARDELQTALDVAGAAVAPTEAEIEIARIFAEEAERIVASLSLLEQLGEQVVAARQEAADAEAAIVELGPVTYDAEAHRTAEKGLERARAAVTRIDQIDMELASRARYEGQRDAAVRDLASLAECRTQLESERGALGFDEARLRQAQDEEVAARGAARTARDEAARVRDALRDALATRDRVVAERDRLVRLAEEAERRGREADELDRMYREFAEFDKFVADHVGPLLAETTERLLSLVTHGKYDRVRFDENYGIEVFDGDECFKLEGFSGGERDVVALCARLAMSELVGSSALRPPRFLVLDEVFGSLDSERRSQLLETLGSLAYGGHFQQMFIISHVDDVQQSPVMNEAWTIEERAGVSHVVRPESLIPALASS